MSVDWTRRQREERFYFQQLDTRLRPVGMIETVDSCGLDWSIWSSVRGSGDLVMRTPTAMVWPQVIVRPWMVVTSGREREAIPLMTAVCRMPDETRTPAGVDVSVDMQELTMLLAERMLREPYLAGTFAPVTEQVQHILVDMLGFTNVAITHSTKTLQTERLFLPSDEDDLSWLTVVNELCELIGYASVTTDGRGTFQVRPYTAPRDRTPRWRFADDRQSLRYLPEIGVAHEEGVTFNAWSYWTRAAEGVAPVAHHRTNVDPNHPFSTASLGYQITRTKRDLEGDVAALIERDMAEDMTNQRTFTLDARYVPIVEDDAAHIDDTAGGLPSMVATLAKRQIRCKAGSPVGLTFREVLR